MTPDDRNMVALLHAKARRLARVDPTYRCSAVTADLLTALDALEAAEGTTEKLRGLNDMQAKALEAAEKWRDVHFKAAESLKSQCEAAEKRAETLRAALERLHVAGKDAADALSFRPIREALRGALTAAERALKGEG